MQRACSNSESSQLIAKRWVFLRVRPVTALRDTDSRVILPIQIASERQQQLLRELEEEDKAAAEREAKKLKDAQKKKDKKKLAKLQKEQEKQQREEERLAAEAAAKAEKEAKAEAERQRLEEQKAKREAERKAKELEAQKKEEAKKARLAEEARKKKEKDEKIKEARLAREREEKERKAKEEADRKAKQEAERKEREEKERQREEAAKKAAAAAEKERQEKEKAAAAAVAEQAAKDAAAAKSKAAAASAASAKAPSTAAKQTPQRASSAKAIPGLPKPATPAVPASAQTPATQSSANAPQAFRSAVSGVASPPTGSSSPSMIAQQRPPSQQVQGSQRSFSTSSSGAPGLAGPPGVSRPPSNPPFTSAIGQQSPFMSSAQVQQQQQQQGMMGPNSFGSIGNVGMGSPSPAGARSLGPPGIGMGPNRAFSPLQSQPSLPQGPPGFQPGPPGMGGIATSPQQQRASFSSLGAPGSSPYGNVTGSPGSHARPNAHSPAPGLPVNLPAGQQQQTPAPIGRGPASHSPGPGSMMTSPPPFQHAASGLAALNMDSHVIARPSAAPSTSAGSTPGPFTAAAPGHARRASNTFDASGSAGKASMQPIGRPRFGGEQSFTGGASASASDFGSSLLDDDGGFPASSQASLRSVSPPPAVLGSGSLLEDMMEEEGLAVSGMDDEDSPTLSTRPSLPQAQSAFFGNNVFTPPPPGLAPGSVSGVGSAHAGPGAPSAAAEDIWASAPSSNTSGQAHHDHGAGKRGQPGMPHPSNWGMPTTAPMVAPVVAPDRASVIRDRARISFTQLDAASQAQQQQQQPNQQPQVGLYPIGDVYRVFQALYPDSTSVDVREFLESCLIPGTQTNGNGTFNFQQRGQVLLMGYDMQATG